MSSIRVKAVEGRTAFTAPRGGKLIPHDHFIDVERTPWIDRLLNHHRDIEAEPVKASRAPVASEPPKDSKTAPAA
jgi:hypothetical protein